MHQTSKARGWDLSAPYENGVPISMILAWVFWLASDDSQSSHIKEVFG